MRIVKRAQWIASASALALLATAPGLALAAETDAPAAPSGQLEEIVVTAQKRTENLQRTAIAASVATGGELTRAGIAATTGLANVSSSIKLTSLRGQAQVYVRGIGSSITSVNADPAVALNLNGVYIPPEMTVASMFDVERVEVLPGPQGTLYGRNAAGGAVNIITKKPGPNFGGEAYVEAGSYNAINAFGAVNLPLSDILAVRVAAYNQRHEGYIKGLNGSKFWDQDTTSARATVLFTPTGRTKVLASLSYSKDGGIPNQVQNNPPIPGGYLFIPLDAHAIGLRNDYKTWIGTFQLDQALTDDIGLTYIGGYTRVDGLGNTLAFQGGPVVVFSEQETTAYTHELRLSGRSSRLVWAAGLYAYDQKANFVVEAHLPTVTASNGPFDQHAKGYAAFGQATYSLTDALRLTGGARESHDEKVLSGVNSNLTPAGVLLSRQTYGGSRKDNRFDWKVGVEFDAAPESLLYASVQTGYNQGGFSTAPLTATSTLAAPFLPATVLAYTAGSKNRFFDRRLQLNFEAFYYDYKNYQVSSRNQQTAQLQVYNATKAQSYGLQVDASWLATPADRLDVGATILHAVSKQLFIPPATNLNGFELPFSPATSVNATYAHTWSMTNGSKVEAALTGRFVGSLWATYFHGVGTYEPAYGKLDATVTYRSPDDRWSVAFWVRNITNKMTYAILNTNVQPGPGAGYLDAPRTAGVRVAANF